jgi:hypothetical protein
MTRSKLPLRPTLDLLQRIDRFRVWNSLDDRRRCLVCDRVFTGHEVVLVGGDGKAPLRACCPTPGCSSIPMDWAKPDL